MAPPSSSSSPSSSMSAHHVIVDSGGFISNAPIKDLASNVYCIQEVVDEIKDKATKQRLQVLPYSISFREPSAESVATVSAFAKKTGDYRSLSATDVKLIALTYQLEKEHVGTSHLRCEPPKKPESVIISSKRNESQDSTIAGFYLGDLSKHHDKPTQKKKVVDDLINSLEKLKVAVEEVKSDFTRSPSYEGEELTSNETVYSSFNYWREPLLDLDNLLDPSLLATTETTISPRSTNQQQNAKKPTPPPKPAHLISPKKKSGSTSSASSSSGVNDVTSGLNDVTSPDFDDFLYWKADMCLSPEEIDCMLLKDSGVSGGTGKGVGTAVEVERCEGKREKEKENEERKRMTDEDVSSWGDLGRKVREEEEIAVTREKQDLSSMLEGKVVQGGTDDMSEDEDDDEEEQQQQHQPTTTSFGGFGGGWITPKNIGSIKKDGNDDEERSEPLKVACLTTDFAMQNVLIQMGLNVIGVNGKVIKRARSYALRCYGCFKLTFNQEKRFCPHCGNETLKRVSIKVNDDGTLKYFISLRKPLSPQGKNQTLPPPRGGKHSTDPIVFEDQRVPHNRPSKMASKSTVDALDVDFVARDSPFATNDVTSRAALMGINHNRRGGGGG